MFLLDHFGSGAKNGLEGDTRDKKPTMQVVIFARRERRVWPKAQERKNLAC